MSRFKAVGNFVYEKGDRIGCTPDEAAVELARKLNAYQMRVERFKAEIEQLKATDIVVQASVSVGKTPVLYLAEIARLKAEVERLTAFTTRTIIPNEELQAQVERLTKAGDAMADALNLNDDVFDNHEKKLAKTAWNSAKEGKQP